jgi:cbb3-type cytochrome oxidase cytochrome c subunit
MQSLIVMRKLGKQQRGLTMIGMLLLIVVLGFMALIAVKVIPIYIQHFTIKSTIESIRKERQPAQVSLAGIQIAIQKRFDVSHVDKIIAKDLKLRNERNRWMLGLVHEDDPLLFYGLHVVLKVNEAIHL